MTPNKCRQCGKEIICVSLESGSMKTFDAEPNEYGNGFLGADEIMRIVTPEPPELKGQMVSMPLYSVHQCKE